MKNKTAPKPKKLSNGHSVRSTANDSNGGFFELRLYVAGQSPKSLSAVANLKKICHEHLEGRFRINVIDLVKTPHLAQGDQILAIPTLVRKLPEPIRKNPMPCMNARMRG